MYSISDNETSRNGRWMFGRTLAFVIDLTVDSLMANVRTKEKVNEKKIFLLSSNICLYSLDLSIYKSIN
jgi:hypothetical protein